MTGSVVPIAAGPSLAAAVDEFLARPRLDRGTARSYAQALTRLAGDLDAGGLLGQLSPEQVAGAFTAAWDGVAPRTWNRHLAAVRSFRSWAAGRWPVVDLAAHLERRKENPDRTKVIDRHRIEALWERRDIPLREKTLWRLLYESAARAQEVLGLNIEDLDLDNKRGRAIRKGGRVEWIQWQSGAARLLPRLVAGRTRGPVFLAERRPARTRTPAAADLCPTTGRGRLSYQRAEYLFKKTTGGATLHQLRHSRLTHLGEAGWSAPMLMALSGHENLRTLGLYVNPSHEAVAALLADHDPGRRRRPPPP